MSITYPDYKSVQHLIQIDIISPSEFTKILHRFELQSGVTALGNAQP